ncbi:MAG: hypothetical protein OEV31_08175 [Gammaproteobacteria bacterium]|nr:hypothetical protein [Gammaproteobacteria bacterium]
MFDFFKTQRDHKGDPAMAAARMGAMTSQAAASTRPPEPAPTSRELIRLVLRDTLRKNGIPTDWIASQIATRAQSGHVSSHQIQLVMLKWHEGLLRFAPLLQQQILQGIRQFEPHADDTTHNIVWSFAPSCGCPYTTLPAPDYWESSLAKQKFDLPPTARKFHEVDDDFATTVPSTFR